MEEREVALRLRGAAGSRLTKAKLKSKGVGRGWRLQYLKRLLWHSLFSGGICGGEIDRLPFKVYWCFF